MSYWFYNDVRVFFCSKIKTSFVKTNILHFYEYQDEGVYIMHAICMCLHVK